MIEPVTEPTIESMIEPTIESVTDPQPDYDSPWKDILERFFRQFLQFCFPAVHDGIDWNREYTFLDNERFEQQLTEYHEAVSVNSYDVL